MNPALRPKVLVAKGPIACERALTEAIDQDLSRLGFEALRRPLHLLVPSHSLRRHLLGCLARQRGGVVGVGCLTLRGLASEVLERAGEPPPAGSWMVPILVRRAARRHPALRSCLGHLHDGYANLIGAVTDLLEAGLEPALVDALDEVLSQEGRSVANVAEVQRARSLVQLASQVQQQMIDLGLGHASALLPTATELLRTRTDLEFRSSGIHVYGFADATGVATDLLEAALLRFGGTVYLDHPPDPAHPELEDPSFEFSRRFSTRLSDLGRRDGPSTEVEEKARIELFAAAGGQAETREVGERIRRLLDNGMRAEEIGVVARQLESYRSPLRIHFPRLGIPFSASGAPGPLLPLGRRIRALLEILSRGERVRLDRWLDARPLGSGTTPSFDLRLAMFGLGVGRIDELAAMSPDLIGNRDFHPLPVRLGFIRDEDDTEARLSRRRIPSAELSTLRDEAIALRALLADWTGATSWQHHLEHLERLLSLLAWSDSDPATGEIRRSVEGLARGIPGSMELDPEEFTRVLLDNLGTLGTDSFGGRGAGVQVLDVIEARGRTFGHLFVLGLNRGSFPRTVREDPALPDDLRHLLAREGHGVLPDLPLKRAGFAEERFLFAQLCAASPHVTLSWQTSDDDDRELTTSPLVERLLWTREPSRVSLPQLSAQAADAEPRWLTTYESATRAALLAERREIEAALAAASPDDLTVPAADLAAARLAVVEELNRPSGETSELGPYFGFVGPSEQPDEPRRVLPIYVTTLESMAVCPWRTFLERLLRLEVLPDPIEVLPTLDPYLTGRVVHRVLERLIRSHLLSEPTSLEEARVADPVEIRWPEPQALARLVRSVATEIAVNQGMTWAGVVEVLTQIALPFLARARLMLWEGADGAFPVAAELDTSLSVGASDRQRPIYFQVDRVDRLADRLVLSDYKTGRRGVSEAKQQKTRDRHLLTQIRSGRLLQAAAYARAAGSSADQGRYVFLHPDFAGPEDGRLVSVAAVDTSAMEAFERAVDNLLTAWDSGVFFPRLIEPDTDKEPPTCNFCAVSHACLRGDSSARGRLRDWSGRRRTRSRLERVFLDGWLLASAKESTR